MSFNDLKINDLKNTLSKLDSLTHPIKKKLTFLGVYSLVCFKNRDFDDFCKYYKYRLLSEKKNKFYPKTLLNKEIKIEFNSKSIIDSKNKLYWEDEKEKIYLLDNIDEIDNSTKLLIWDDGGIGDFFLQSGLLTLLPKNLNFKIKLNSKIDWVLKNFKKNIVNDDTKYKFTHHTSILQLQSLLKININTYNKNFNHLKSSNNNYWKDFFKKYKKYNKIGLIIKTETLAKKNIPFSSILELLELNKGKKFFLIDLRPEDKAIDYASKNKNLIILSKIDQTLPFQDTYQIINNLDLLITIDTAGSHIAGYFKIKTIMLLDSNPHYYWGDFSSDTIFYKNHFIIRSEKKNQWKNAIIELNKKINL